MANKKNSGNKKKTTSKKSVSKKKQIQAENAKKIESVGEFNVNYQRIVIVGSIIIIIFCAFYFLTVYITGRDKDNSKNDTTEDSGISYTDTIAGRSFSMPENEYIVLYYDHSDSELEEQFSEIISTYRMDPDHFALYSVDLSDAMNKPYVSEESNSNPSKASELAISGPTLIHFKEGSVIEYIEGAEDITYYLQ